MAGKSFRVAHAARALFGACLLAGLAACGSVGGGISLINASLFPAAGATTPAPSGGGAGGPSGFFGGGGRANTDPCTEAPERKFIRVSMRNLAPLDSVHYFVTFIAYVNGATYPNGAVCMDDIDLYLQNGYEEIPDGSSRDFGNYCIAGPALIRFHESGRFKAGGGSSGATSGSSIGRAQGTSPSFDSFFTSSGARIPVPNAILWHNPGIGEGGALKVSRNNQNPCSTVVSVSVDSDCNQDAFYYVDNTDLQNGSNRLGAGSGRRVPNEIQGTGCECGAFDFVLNTAATQVLAPSGATASTAQCNEFLRGGLIEFVFLREDTNPPFPQLVWRVTDSSGSIAHDFDPRAEIP